MKFACTVLFVAYVSHCLTEEHHCSKYDFKEKVFQKLIKMEFDVDRMKCEVDEQQKKLDEIAAGSKPNPTIAFTSRNPHNLKPQDGERIIFTTTLTNHGGGYDNKTGVFTAPVDGVYLFTTQFCIDSDEKFIFFRIMLNDTPIKGSLINGNRASVCASADAIVVMKASELVWVECGRTSSSSKLLLENSERWNILSGAIIHE